MGSLNCYKVNIYLGLFKSLKLVRAGTMASIIHSHNVGQQSQSLNNISALTVWPCPHKRCII